MIGANVACDLGRGAAEDFDVEIKMFSTRCKITKGFIFRGWVKLYTTIRASNLRLCDKTVNTYLHSLRWIWQGWACVWACGAKNGYSSCCCLLIGSSMSRVVSFHQVSKNYCSCKINENRLKYLFFCSPKLVFIKKKR